MGDSPASDVESSKPSPASDVLFEMDRRPFGSLEFQVSEVVERLEASVNSQDAQEKEEPKGMRRISAGFFEPEETSMDEILKILENLVLKTDPSSDSLDPPLLPTDAVTRAAILSHSIAALFGRLERSHASKLGAHVAAETTRWLQHMFRLPNYHAYYHQEQMEGLVKVTRMLLHHKYPRYLEDGALAFVNRLPCIYSCVASPLNVVQHLCRQLGLPLACVRPVPVHPSGRGMDTDALNKLCEEDVNENRIPLLVLGEAGAPPLGCGSDLTALSAVCRTHSLYMHLRGHALVLPAVLNRDESFNIADSLTLTPGVWFGVPGLPAVTFYRIPEAISVNDQAKGVNTTSSREAALMGLSGLAGGGARVPSLPLWACIRAAGARTLIRRLRDALYAAREAYTAISASGLRLCSERPGGDELPTVDIVDAVSRASACVAFQFAAPGVEKQPPYYDKLNSWLGQVLQRESEMMSVEVCETERYGAVVRYCPLEGGAVGAVEAGSECARWEEALEAHLAVLHATVTLKEPFASRVTQHPLLRLVTLPGWAGLGGVRYVPAGWEDVSPDELNSLNRKLVETLKATDGAFSCGEGEDGMACVRFGMVTVDTDIDELLELVITAGKEVEESSRALTNMTEVLKKGIEKAQADLERESWERGGGGAGVLRRVPVVGRVVQWWAPAPPPPPGRTLHLALGTLQTTQDMYRHVQKNKESSTPTTEAHAPTTQTQDTQ